MYVSLSEILSYKNFNKLKGSEKCVLSSRLNIVMEIDPFWSQSSENLQKIRFVCEKAALELKTSERAAAKRCKAVTTPLKCITQQKGASASFMWCLTFAWLVVIIQTVFSNNVLWFDLLCRRRRQVQSVVGISFKTQQHCMCRSSYVYCWLITGCLKYSNMWLSPHSLRRTSFAQVVLY